MQRATPACCPSTCDVKISKHEESRGNLQQSVRKHKICYQSILQRVSNAALSTLKFFLTYQCKFASFRTKWRSAWTHALESFSNVKIRTEIPEGKERQ